MGRTLELTYEDEEANPSVAVQKAEKLFEIGKVDFLTGTVNSGSTLAVGQLAERSGKLIATTVSFADSITGDRCSPNVFRVNARAGQQSAALASWLAKEMPHAKVFFLGPDYEMGRSTVAAFKANVERVGSTSVGEVFAPLDRLRQADVNYFDLSPSRTALTSPRRKLPPLAAATLSRAAAISSRDRRLAQNNGPPHWEGNP
jgi:branched-chain amino acid transport system substrate-binding protein